MSSALAEVSNERMENQLNQTNWIGCPQVEQQAWIGGADSSVAVGGLAEKFSPSDRRREPKYENALYKILAAIGVIVETHSISKRRKFRVKLGLLLPWNEYKDQERLLEQLKILAAEYDFRGHKVRVRIESHLCYPEGGGIAMARVRQKGGSWFKRQKLGVLMLGDRNCTALYFESGMVQKGTSPLIGFSFLLDRIIEDSPCLLNQEKLIGAIFTGIEEGKKKQLYSGDGRPLWSEMTSIQSLATARNEKLRQSEIEDISKAIEMMTLEWDHKILDFMKEVFPKKLTEITVGGGSLPFFTPLIEKHFNCALDDSPEGYSPINRGDSFTPVLISGGITQEVGEALNFKSTVELESAYSTRFADVFSFIQYLIDRDTKSQKAKQKPKQKVG